MYKSSNQGHVAACFGDFNYNYIYKEYTFQSIILQSTLIVYKHKLYIVKGLNIIIVETPKCVFGIALCFADLLIILLDSSRHVTTAFFSLFPFQHIIVLRFYNTCLYAEQLIAIIL